MPRVIHFEIHADNPDRAVAFYETVFGWKVQKWSGPNEYWLLSTGDSGPGINGGLLRRRTAAPTPGAAINAFICTIDVPSLEEFLAKALAAGGTMALPKMPIAGVGWLAYVKDTEGNCVGMMQADTSAA